MDRATTAFVFPGQGSQEVGMGLPWVEAFAQARETFDEADEALGRSLSKRCFEGPEEELKLTANTQPALLTTSIAYHRVLTSQGFEAAVTAGHSLGEYSAVVAAGGLDFATAVRVVEQRGRFMQEAVPVGEGGMAAILGLDVEQVAAVAEEASTGGQVCALANLNSEGQTVIAGHTAAVERAVELAREAGARKAVVLAVSAPFHSPLMAPARERLAPVLGEAPFRDLRVPVVTNVDAAPAMSGDAARDALIRQVDSPVRWTESVAAMASGLPGLAPVETFLEIGPGKVLTGLNRRIARGTKCLSLARPEDLEKLVRASEAET